MRSLAEVQAEFAAALRDPTIALPSGIVGPDEQPAPRRFAVYRNNVIVGLTNALRSAFPVVERIVGEQFFEAMARTYALAEPPHSPVLMDYGTTFADFIAGFEPASSLPYLADVARIERAWREAYHAADAVPLTAEDFAAVGADEIAGLVLELHPSLRLLTSRFPAQTIWKMNASDGDIVPVDMSRAEDTLIVRPDAEVEVRVVPPGGAAFVAAHHVRRAARRGRCRGACRRRPVRPRRQSCRSDRRRRDRRICQDGARGDEMTMNMSNATPMASTTAAAPQAWWPTVFLWFQSVASLALRLALAVPFYRSGLTKWDGFLSLAPTTTYLFENQFKLHIFGSEYAFPYPDLMAHLSATGEIVFPVLLVLGLATRFAALGTLGMTALIFLTYPSHWPNEGLPWAAMALAIMAFGPGRIALDRLVMTVLGR